MQILFKISIKKNPVRFSLLIVLLFSVLISFSQAKYSADHYFQKGLLEKQNGRRLESLKQFEKAIKYDANNKPVLNELASAYVDLRKQAQAIDVYKKLVELGDATANNYKQLLILSFNYKNSDDVLLYAGKLKAADPAEKVSFYLGKIQYDRENYGEAIQHLNTAIKEEPLNAEAPYMIARSYADMMNYKQAIPYFQKAIQIDTSKSYWVYEMALIYYAMNDDKNSLKYMLVAADKGMKKDNDFMENLAIAQSKIQSFADRFCFIPLGIYIRLTQ